MNTKLRFSGCLHKDGIECCNSLWLYQVFEIIFDVVVDLLTTVFEFRSKKALENYLLTARTSFGKQLLLQD